MSTDCIVIIGGTSVIAQECARLWLHEGPVRLVLAGRDIGRLEQVAADLGEINSSTEIECHSLDFTDPAAVSAFTENLCHRQTPDIVLIAQGYLPDQLACQQDIAKGKAALDINAISPVLFAEAFAAHMATTGGKLVIIGSIAGDRGRKSNYIYGSAKCLLACYAEGMQHRFADSRLKVVFVKPGPASTPKTVEQHQRGLKLAPVSQVAGDIVRGVRHNKPIIYTPGKWAWIMWVIRHMPRYLFNRMDI